MSEKFSELQLDVLKEICNVATATSASAISQILNKKIEMKVPRIDLVPIERATKEIGEPGLMVAGIYAQLLGDFTGGLLVTFPREHVIQLASKLTGSAAKAHTVGELNLSAIQEIGNIILASFVSTISKIANKTILMSVPKLAFDMLGAIVDFILIELAAKADHALLLEIEFQDVPKTISGHFFILPDTGSMSLLLKSMELKLIQKKFD